MDNSQNLQFDPYNSEYFSKFAFWSYKSGHFTNFLRVCSFVLQKWILHSFALDLQFSPFGVDLDNCRICDLDPARVDSLCFPPSSWNFHISPYTPRKAPQQWAFHHDYKESSDLVHISPLPLDLFTKIFRCL